MSELRPRVVGGHSRFFILVLSEINLLIGALFFVDPTQSVGLWPWPVKELAVRFLGAIFLAIAFGCWSVLRAKVWQRGKILPVVGATFYGITTVIIALQIPLYGRLALALSWIAFLSAATIGLVAIVYKHPWHRTRYDRIFAGPRQLAPRLFFLTQTLVVGIFGVAMLFLPDFAQQHFWPWHVAVPTLQAFAGLFLATCVATAWASLQADKGRILALLPLDASFPALALLAVFVHWSVILSESPTTPVPGLVTAVWVFLYSFVSAGSFVLYLFLRREEVRTT